jgi:cell division protein FtsL
MSRSVRQFKETIEMRRQSLLQIRSHRYFPLSIVLAAFLLVACLHIWQRVHVIHLIWEVSELGAENRNLVDETKKAQTDVSALSMASRIQSFAADSLGMRQMSSERVFTLTQEHEKAPVKSNELASVVTSIKRVVDYLPVITEAQAGASEIKQLKFDSLNIKEPKR